jgi:hypothetical protein
MENKQEPFIFSCKFNWSRKLFCPVNDKAKDLCKFARRKNLTIEQLEFYFDGGYKIEIYPKIDIGEKLNKCLRFDNVC